MFRNKIFMILSLLGCIPVIGMHNGTGSPIQQPPLPPSMYQPNNRNNAGQPGNVTQESEKKACAICKNDCEAHEAMTQLICHHQFHLECIVQHLVAGPKRYDKEEDNDPSYIGERKTRSFCPLCNKAVVFMPNPNTGGPVWNKHTELTGEETRNVETLIQNEFYRDPAMVVEEKRQFRARPVVAPQRKPAARPAAAAQPAPAWQWQDEDQVHLEGFDHDPAIFNQQDNELDDEAVEQILQANAHNNAEQWEMSNEEIEANLNPANNRPNRAQSNNAVRGGQARNNHNHADANQRARGDADASKKPPFTSKIVSVGADTLAGFFMGLLMSKEWEKPQSKDEIKALNSRRYLYAPTAVASWFLVEKINPNKPWTSDRIWTSIFGCALGMLVPQLRKSAAPATSA